MQKRVLVVLGAVIVVAAVAFVVRNRLSHHASASKDAGDKRHRTMHVARSTQPLELNGELTEAPWRATQVAHFVKPDGSDARPYNDIRFLWSEDGLLHVGIYASDLNIISAGVDPDGPVWRGDSFHVVFSNDDVEHGFDIGLAPDGGSVLTDGERRSMGAWSYAWTSGARLRIDMDEGTVDNPKDKDEEWVVEMQIPLKSLGLEPKAGQRIDVTARRCDVDRRGGPPLETPCPETDVLELVFDP